MSNILAPPQNFFGYPKFSGWLRHRHCLFFICFFAWESVLEYAFLATEWKLLIEVLANGKVIFDPYFHHFAS